MMITKSKTLIKNIEYMMTYKSQYFLQTESLNIYSLFIYFYFAGQKFAFLELKAVLYGILKNFVILPVDTPDTVILVPDMVLRSKEEKVMLKFLPRK